MPTVLHVLDATCDETTLQVLDTLLSHAAEHDLQQVVCGIDGPVVTRAMLFIQKAVIRAERRVWQGLNWSPALPQIARRCGAEILHAWGIQAAGLCSSRMPEYPLILTVSDSRDFRHADRWVRSLPVDATVIAGDECLYESLGHIGIVDERRVLIRPPVDAQAIAAVDRAIVREAIVGDASSVILLTGPATPGGGQSQGLWASAIVSQVVEGLRVVLPYPSREARRVWKFARDIQMPSLLVEPDPTYTWAELVACADVLMAPAISEVNTYPIAVAMAGEVPIIGTSVPPISGLLQNGQAGSLCEPGLPRSLASRLLKVLEDEDARRQAVAKAKDQADLLFAADAQVRAHVRVYENIRAGRLPATGLQATRLSAASLQPELST